MVTLFEGLRSAANALEAMAEALATTQMNMTNAGVTGYARRNVHLRVDGFDPTRGLPGGVRGSSLSARSQYAEQAVWSQTSQKGFFDSFTQSANGVDHVLGLDDVTGRTGIRAALSDLFQSFANLRLGSTDPVNQQNVVEKAQALALTTFQTADFLQQSLATAQSRIQATVDQVNSLVNAAQQWNAQLNAGAQADPMAEAQVYINLETLSTLVPITVQKESNGGLTILLNGQEALLQGSQQFPLSISFATPESSANFPNAPAQLRIRNAAGEDITSSITAGELGGLLDYSNRFLPSLLGDSNQQGDLNRLAQGIANSVNSALGGPQPMFQFDGNPVNRARSLQLSSSFTREDLAAAIMANPSALVDLAGIAGGVKPTDQIDGQSYSAFLVSLSSRAAASLNTVSDGLNLQSRLVDQAQAFRETVQGASVEQSAVELLQYQRAFEAAAKVIRIIDDLTLTTINMVR